MKALFEPLPQGMTPTENLSVVLSDTFMFEETDLESYLAARAGTQANHTKRTPTLFLPKVEVENPLQWATLVHEMGHAIYEPAFCPLSGDEIQVITAGNAAGIDILNSWLQEIFCDFVSLYLLGPAYLAAFIDFMLVVSSEGLLEEASESHPPPALRIHLMSRSLELQDIESRFELPLFGKWQDVGGFFVQMMHSRRSIQRIHYNPPLQDLNALPIDTHELRIRLEEKISELLPAEIRLPPFDKKRFSCLSRRLQDGVPIGSCSLVETIGTEKTDALADLDFMDRGLEGGDPENPDEILTKLHNVGKRISESPCKIAEIVNAGWLYKCEHIYARVVEKIDSLDDENERMLNTSLCNLDNLLRNSIETAYLGSLLLPALVNSVD
ncbi:MAG: hypothetical protein HY706_05415 [Candidatus Hydrogenedentes bacterium]|nr:hypothetical protein [Candidatus Hydrogenedentota bacterium]